MMSNIKTKQKASQDLVRALLAPTTANPVAMSNALTLCEPFDWRAESATKGVNLLQQFAWRFTADEDLCAKAWKNATDFNPSLTPFSLWPFSSHHTSLIVQSIKSGWLGLVKTWVSQGIDEQKLIDLLGEKMLFCCDKKWWDEYQKQKINTLLPNLTQRMVVFRQENLWTQMKHFNAIVDARQGDVLGDNFIRLFLSSLHHNEKWDEYSKKNLLQSAISDGRFQNTSAKPTKHTDFCAAITPQHWLEFFQDPQYQKGFAGIVAGTVFHRGNSDHAQTWLDRVPWESLPSSFLLGEAFTVLQKSGPTEQGFANRYAARLRTAATHTAAPATSWGQCLAFYALDQNLNKGLRFDAKPEHTKLWMETFGPVWRNPSCMDQTSSYGKHINQIGAARAAVQCLFIMDPGNWEQEWVDLQKFVIKCSTITDATTRQNAMDILSEAFFVCLQKTQEDQPSRPLIAHLFLLSALSCTEKKLASWLQKISRAPELAKGNPRWTIFYPSPDPQALDRVVSAVDIPARLQKEKELWQRVLLNISVAREQASAPSRHTRRM